MHNKTLAKIRKILYNKIIKTNECKQQIEKKGKNVKKKKIKKILTVLVAHHSPVVLRKYPALTLPVVTHAQAVAGLF